MPFHAMISLIVFNIPESFFSAKKNSEACLTDIYYIANLFFTATLFHSNSIQVYANPCFSEVSGVG